VKEAIDLAVKVNRILPRYIDVHDSIFKFSLRHAIPIPGIFKPIRYGSHYENLYFIKEELEDVIVATLDLPEPENEAESQFVRILNLYSNALLEAITILREICGALYGKSEGNLKTYSKKQYGRDLERYQVAVLKYSELGQFLTAYFKR
jgi:hypothetical protein